MSLSALLLDYGKSLLDEVVAGITPAFAYLEFRLTGECDPVYSCKHSYLICELAQLFDPSYIAANVITAEFVARLDEFVPFAARPGLVEELQRDLHLYVAAAGGFISTKATPMMSQKACLVGGGTMTVKLGSGLMRPGSFLPCHRVQRQQYVSVLCSRPSSGATKTVPSRTTFGGQ